MATIKRVVLVCDGCGAENPGDGNGPVVVHKLAVDGVSWQVDACTACWAKYREAVALLATNANRVRIPRAPRKLTAVG